MQEEQQRLPPPAYMQHEPESFQLPSVPTHAPDRQSSGRLPGVRTLDLRDASPPARHAARASVELPALHSATFPKVPDGLPADMGSPMDTASVLSAQDAASVSMDDPDVRLAAEALSGLGNPDFVRSPTARSFTMAAREPAAEPQPMLSLLTSNHPWLGGTISGSLAAYNLTKDYSPRFVKYGAELVERNVGSPVVNTVSSVGRRTGMEQNLRRYLGEQHRRPSDLEQGDADLPRKRQRAASPSADAMDVDSRTESRARGNSQSSYAESLPAYDDHRSPTYEENAPATDSTAAKDPQPSAVQDRRVPWSTQLIMTTSGLGAALSTTSLRSLKQCLHLLRSATRHIDAVMHALRLLLAEYETALHQSSSSPSSEEEEKDPRVRAIAQNIKTLTSDIWTTLQRVVHSVSRYTGGALPQNASQVVRTQLLSVPQRWQQAGRRAQPDEEAGAANAGADASVERGERGERGEGGEAVRGANRMLAFAMEGLDMMGQITTVVDGTVRSAETWLARIGRAGPVEQRHDGEGRAERNNGFDGVNGDEKR